MAAACDVNDREAEKWYRKAAEQKDVRAQSDLGWFLHEGRGAKRDDKEAAAWMRKAAEQNEPFAQNNLGLMYAQGCGVPQDDVQAVAWYRKAGEQNLAMAQTNLGTMYLDGKGVPRDEALAIEWFRKAAAQGSEEARNNLAVLEKVQGADGFAGGVCEGVRWGAGGWVWVGGEDDLGPGWGWVAGGFGVRVRLRLRRRYAHFASCGFGASDVGRAKPNLVARHNRPNVGATPYVVVAPDTNPLRVVITHGFRHPG